MSQATCRAARPRGFLASRTAEQRLGTGSSRQLPREAGHPEGRGGRGAHMLRRNSARIPDPGTQHALRTAAKAERNEHVPPVCCPQRGGQSRGNPKVTLPPHSTLLIESHTVRSPYNTPVPTSRIPSRATQSKTQDNVTHGHWP